MYVSFSYKKMFAGKEYKHFSLRKTKKNGNGEQKKVLWYLKPSPHFNCSRIAKIVYVASPIQEPNKFVRSNLFNTVNKRGK